MSESDGSLDLYVSGGVATVTLNNTDVRNALSPSMTAAVAEICGEVETDRSIGAAVIQGAQGTFCSGADTRGWDPGLPQAGEIAYARATAVYDGVRRLGRLPVPTVAAVRGAAVGAGLNLALATDIRVIADSAVLRAGFLAIGLHPGGGFFTLMTTRGGAELAASVGLFGQTLHGTDALAAGIATAAPPDREVESHALELARTAAADPELARAAVASMRREIGPPQIPWDTAIEAERGVQMWSQHRRLSAQT